MNCGHKLARPCPNCATELSLTARFCFNCGFQLTAQPPADTHAAPHRPPSDLSRYLPPELLGKLEAARAGGRMAGERRIVTILFCDVKGSTSAAEQLDPEDWAEIINGAFEHMIRNYARN